MKPLIVLLAVFFLSLGATWLLTGDVNYALSGTIAMSAMLLLTASGHFMFAKGMESMLPSFIPFKKMMVFFTGIIEIAAAIGLLIVKLEYLTAWLLIIFFIMVLPANISAALRGIDYQKGTAGGPGSNYLWFRIPLQLLFIGWVYFFVIWLNK
ncbi:MAG: Membrane protein [Chitinophagaceae bacterium]|nr:Membrane protein [Chitinophagaceae bacterium]